MKEGDGQDLLNAVEMPAHVLLMNGLITQEEYEDLIEAPDDEAAEKGLRQNNKFLKDLVESGSDFVVKRVLKGKKQYIAVIVAVSALGFLGVRHFKAERAAKKEQQREE